MTDPVERPEAETTAEERARWSVALERDIKSRTGSAMDLFLAMVLRDLARAKARANEATAERDEALAHAQEWQRRKAVWKKCAIKLGVDLDAATARAERLAGALPDLGPVITWLADGCHVPSAVAALRLLKGRIDALLTEPEAKGGDPAPVSGRCQITGKYPWLVSHNVCSCDPCRTWRDTSFHVSPSAPVPATTEKTDAREALRLAALDAEVCVHECPHCGYSEPIKDWDISYHVLAAARAAGITTTEKTDD